MMFRKILLSVVLVVAAGSAAADDYTYIAGGWQYGRINSAQDMNAVLNKGFVEKKEFSLFGPTRSTGTRQQLDGYFLNGGYGFDNNLFLDIRLNYMANQDFDIQEDVLGMGYHYALSDRVDLYGLAGVSTHNLSDDKWIFGELSKSFTSATGEAGLKIKLTPDISVNSALRLASYDAETYYEMRLGAAYALTEHVSMEAGYQYHHWRADHQAGTLGLRYTF